MWVEKPQREIRHPQKTWSSNGFLLMTGGWEMNERLCLVKLGFRWHPSRSLTQFLTTVTYPARASSITSTCSWGWNSHALAQRGPPTAPRTSQGCQGREGAKKSFNPGLLLMKCLKFRLCSLQVQLYLQLQRYTKKNKIYLNLGSIFRLHWLSCALS